MRITHGALLLLGLLAASAAAQEACLTGGATLGDQRALRALRATTETVCPCAAFASAGRGTYRRCAKQQLDLALAGLTLRADCRKTALGEIKGATCGTTKLACGRVRPSATTPVGCKVKAADRCRDRSGIDETACPAETHCSDVVEWSAGTCVDPRVPGPVNAGARIVSLTKTSVVTGLPRVLDTIVWYPTTATGAIDPGTGAILDAPVDPTGGPHPLLLFSHGLCGLPGGEKYLMPLLASYGFVVAAMPHPGSTLLDYPACQNPTNIINSAIERPPDAIFVLDSMLAATADPGSPFFGTVDGSRVGMSGHSFGGYTTFRAVELDPRFRVALLFAPAVPTTLPAVPVPSLMMLGELDSVTVNGFGTSNTRRREAYAAAAAPRMLVEIQEAGHFAFSDGCFPGFPIDCNFPVTLSQDEAHAVVRRFAFPFLQRYLRGDATYETFLTLPAPPGVVAERVP